MMERTPDTTKIESQINELTKAIEEKSAMIKALQDEVASLKDTCARLKLSLTGQEYYDKVETFLKNAKHYDTHRLDSHTPTVSIMTALRRGYYKRSTSDSTDQPIDYFILDNRYVVLYPKNHQIPRVEVAGSITATQFKSDYGELTTQPFTGIIVKLQDGYEVKLFVRPYVLRAQTDYDMDYRKEWSHGVLVHNGNNYGDTSSFYIVG